MTVSMDHFQKYCNFTTVLPSEASAGAIASVHCRKESMTWISHTEIHKNAVYSRDVAWQLCKLARFLMEKFPDPMAMEEYCAIIAEDRRNGNNYTLYYEGEYCNCVVEVTIFSPNYGLHIHAYKKGE